MSADRHNTPFRGVTESEAPQIRGFKIGPLRVIRHVSLRLTVVQWCDASVTETPIFKGRYHYADWLLQNHGRFRNWPVGFQIWR